MTPSATPILSRRHERGGVSWVSLVLLLGLVTSVYLLVVWSPVYILHYEVKQTVRDYMNQAVKNRDDAKLVENLCAKLRSLDAVQVTDANGSVTLLPVIDLAPSDITWERDTSSQPPMLHVAFEYTREVRYPVLEKVTEWIGTIDLNNDLSIPNWGPLR
jgi:hypothetical protein